jgi:signal transduction histidine kinase
LTRRWLALLLAFAGAACSASAADGRSAATARITPPDALFACGTTIPMMLSEARPIPGVCVDGARSGRDGGSAKPAPSPAMRPRGARLCDAAWRIVPYAALGIVGSGACFFLICLRRERRLHAIQLSVFASLLAATWYFAVDLPISPDAQRCVKVAVAIVIYWALCGAGYRMSAARIVGFPALLHGLPILTLAIMFGYLIVGNVPERVWLIAWPQIALRAVVLGLVFHRAWLDRSWKLALAALTGAWWLATIAQSLVMLSAPQPYGSIRWSTVDSVPLCVVMLSYIAERLILDHEESDTQQRAAVAAERERILQDMHDGIGVHLITALNMARRDDLDREELARSIEESLQDLRLIIDSLDVVGGDVLPLLGNLRFRLEPRLAALGIRLDWQVQPPLPELSYLTPESALSILRIVQEAINNAIQHASPRTVCITVRTEAEWILIEVADDGSGFALRNGPQPSRGLSGMRVRAARLGARLAIESDVIGTRIGLRLPRRST